MNDLDLDHDLRALSAPTIDLLPADVARPKQAGRRRRRRTAATCAAVAAVFLLLVVLGSSALLGRHTPTNIDSATAPSRTIELVPAASATPDQIRAATLKIDARLHALGVNGSADTAGGVIRVHLANPADERVIPIVAQSNPVTFRPVLLLLDRPAGTTAPLHAGAGTGAASSVPPTADDPTARVTLAGRDLEYQLGPVLAGPDVVVGATAGFDAQNNAWVVRPRMTDASVQVFNQAAELCYARDLKCPNSQLAIVLDGRVLSAPSINAAHFAPDQIQISGGFTEAQAKALADEIEGSLPISVTVR